MFRFQEFSAAILEWPLSEIERERSCRAQVPDDRFAAFFASHYCRGDGTTLISDRVKHYLWGLQPILEFIGLKWTFMKCTFNSSPLRLGFTCASRCIVCLTLGIRTVTVTDGSTRLRHSLFRWVKSTRFLFFFPATKRDKRLLHNAARFVLKLFPLSYSPPTTLSFSLFCCLSHLALCISFMTKLFFSPHSRFSP